MKALVTGSSGFIGSHVKRKLESLGHEVVGYDLKEMKDVRDRAQLREAMEGCQAVAHLAALCIGQESLEKPEPYFTTNSLGTFNALSLARELGVKAFFYAASAASIEALTPYGQSKLDGQLWTQLFRKLYGMQTFALRFYNVYGEGDDKGVIDAWARKIKAGEAIKIYGDGEQTRDFVNVSDVADTVVEFALNGAKHPVQEIYEVGTGKTVTINQLAELMFKAFGKSVEVKRLPAREGDVLHSKSGRPYIKPKVTMEAGLQRLTKYY